MHQDTLTTLEDLVHQSHRGALSFGALVPRLIELGVESYHVDYRRGETLYRWHTDETHALRTIGADGPVAAELDVAAVRAAISGAQSGEVVYPEFVRRTVAAGCVGYDAWLAGRKVVYHGRRGEQWVEQFPGPAPRPAVAVVQQIYEAFARRDLAGAFSRFAADLEIVQSGEVPWGGHYRGHAGAREFFARLLAALDSTLALERFIDAGDHIVAIGRTGGVTRADGHRYDVPLAHVWTVRDGLATRVEFHIDNPTMLAALAPQP